MLDFTGSTPTGNSAATPIIVLSTPETKKFLNNV